MEQVGEQIFKGLNPAQYQAVSDIEGPQLIIAGAGSGKTAVLVERVINKVIKYKIDIDKYGPINTANIHNHL